MIITSINVFLLVAMYFALLCLVLLCFASLCFALRCFALLRVDGKGVTCNSFWWSWDEDNVSQVIVSGWPK